MTLQYYNNTSEHVLEEDWFKAELFNNVTENKSSRLNGVHVWL